MEKLTEEQLKAAKIQNEIELCVEWIETIPEITTKINKNRTSYGYKHDVERWAGVYISNDSFKEAAKQCGLLTKQATEQNEWYNLTL